MSTGWWHDAAFAVWDDACTAAREADDTPESLGWTTTSVTRHGGDGAVEKMTGRFRCPDASVYEVTILFDADRP